MTERVTSMGGSRLMLGNLQTNFKRLQLLQGQISSGKQVQRSSDGPAQVLSALDLRANLRRSEQEERNVSDAVSWLNNADSALTTSVGYLQRARELVLNGLNGSADAGARAGLASELRGLRDNLLQMANTKYLGRPIFNGTSGASTAYDAAGVYQGDAGAVLRPVAAGVTVQVNEVGPNVFGAQNASPYLGSLFQAVDQLATDVAAGDVAGMNTGLAALDTARSRIEGVQVALGARAKQVADIQTRNQEVSLDLKASLAEVEDIDLTKVLIELRAQEMAYQGALNVTAKVIQPSLLDFLR